MLHKCANPVCSATFLYLHQGRLFEVETQYVESASARDPGKWRKARGHIAHYWLCDLWVEHVALRFDRERGMVAVSSLGASGKAMVTAISQSTPKAAAGSARVLIRPSALSCTEHPQPNGQMRARRFLNVA